jgi:hypothetical protein
VINKPGKLCWATPLERAAPKLKGKEVMIIGIDVHHAKIKYAASFSLGLEEEGKIKEEGERTGGGREEGRRKGRGREEEGRRRKGGGREEGRREEDAVAMERDRGSTSQKTEWRRKRKSSTVHSFKWP